MAYDIFISYRREGGFEVAKHIKDLLERDGYTVSFDIDNLGNGNFDELLLERVSRWGRRRDRARPRGSRIPSRRRGAG